MNTPEIARTILTEIAAELLANPNQSWYDLILRTDAPALGKCMAVILCAENNTPTSTSLQVVETTLDGLAKTIALANTVLEEQSRLRAIPILGEAA